MTNQPRISRWTPGLGRTLIACGLLALVAAGARADDAIGRVIADFALRDTANREHKLMDLADRKAVVVAFIGTECPLAKLYTGRLVELAAHFEPQGVAFLAVDSNRQDSLDELNHYIRTYNVTFPVLRDVGNRVADACGARRTPEVFVLDAQRTVRYRGRIDDQYGIRDQINFARPAPTRNDLEIALTELLGDQKISVPETEAPGCLIGRAREPDPNAPVTFSNQVVRLFQKHCQDCHRPGEIAPFPLLTYEDAAGWDAMIGEVVREGRMPPWHANPAHGHFANDARLSEEEKQLIETWVASGAPEGDPADLPAPREWPAPFAERNWDRIVYIADEPFEVPAQGILEYQYFTVDPQLAEDVWLSEAAAFADSRATVHHMAVFVHPPGDFFRLRRQGQVFEIGGYVPGAISQTASVGHAQNAQELAVRDQGKIRVPAGSHVTFEMHYTASGVPQRDRSGIGLRFGTPPVAEPGEDGQPGPAPEIFKPVQIETIDFVIPPEAAEQPVEASTIMRQDSLLQWLNVHMHLRGKSFRFVALYPDGRDEILLDIPRYDFDWQRVYFLSEPKLLPLGTEVRCLATFDNSSDNLRNPKADMPVIYGHQTWDEMMAGTLGIRCRETAPPLPPPGHPIPPPVGRDVLSGYLAEDQVTPEQRGAYFLRRARYRRGEGDVAGAEQDFNRGIELSPDDAHAWFERSELRRERGALAEAIGDLNRAIALEPGDMRYLVARGRLRTLMQAPDAALVDLDLAISRSPYDAWALYYRSRARTDKQDYGGALADLQRLNNKVHTRFVRGLWDEGVLLYSGDRPAEARAAFDRVLALEPEREPALAWELAQIRLRQGRLDEAATQIGRLLELKPDETAARLLLATVRLQQGRPAEGLTALREAVQLDPQSAGAHLQLADALSAQGEAREAIAHYRTCLQLDPGAVQALNNLAWLLATFADTAVRDPAEAQSLAVALCQTSEMKNPNHLDTLAAAYAAGGDFERAVGAATLGVDLAMAAEDFQRAVKLQERRRLYRDKRPYVDAR